MLAIGATGAGPSAVSWMPTVDVAWFDELVPASKADAQPGLLGVETGPSWRPVVGQDETIAAAPDRWLVQLTPEAIATARNVAGAADLIESFLSLPSPQPDTAYPPINTRVLRGLGIKGMVLLETQPGQDPGVVEAWLESHPYIAYAEPDAPLATAALPNDSAFPRLWGLHNTGQTGGTADADIDAPEAWELTTGSRGVVVAVIDTGIDYTHPDLIANLWTNPGEVPSNGIDDDGNGFVDDLYGYDFANGDPDPLDDNGHGTHVSGIIAAAGNNAQGTTGVTWAGSVMALKFLDAAGNGFTSAAVSALNYATMMRSTYGVDVRVTNNSWGGGGYSQALHDAILASGEAGVLFVAASGNEGIDTDGQPHYPSSYPLSNVVAVAATDHDDRLAPFSNYGPTSVDLAAPGVNIYSTLPGGGYGSYSGTSMAAPHVAGVAALAWSLASSASVDEVRTAILDGVDPVASLADRVVTGGRLNARGTLDQLSLSVWASDPAAESLVAVPPDEVTIWFSYPYDPLSVDAADLRVNGKTADRALIIDSRTVSFQFDATPVAREGPQVMEIQEGAILRSGSGEPVGAWQATFYYDTLPLAVIATTPSQDEVVAAPPAQIVFDFNESVDPQSVQESDLLLSVGSVTAATLVGGESVAYTIVGLPREGEVSYTLAEGAIRDAHGTPGPGHVGHFTIDDPTIERYTSGDVPRPITDHNTTTSTLVVDESYGIADLDVQLDIAHTYDGDLDVLLVAPDGTRVTLFSSVGANGNGFFGTVLDDEAATAIADGEAPFTGRYQPQEPLSALDGSDVMGTWTLEISDHGSRDQGTLGGWALLVERGGELPPRIRSLDPLPPDGGDVWGTLDSLEVRFSKPMDPSSVNDPDSWDLIAAGLDGLFDTADDVDYPLIVSPVYVGGVTATLGVAGAPLPVGSYRLKAASGGLADLSGAPLDGNGDGLGGDAYVTRFRLLPNDWYPSDDVPRSITDLGTTTSTLTISDSFPIADLDLKIDITHPYDADLDVYLIAPNGTRIELFTDVGGSGDNFTGTILDDEAETAIADGQAPFADRYRPAQPLAAVDGLDAQGTWTLEISDDGRVDQGTLRAWAIIVERAPEIPPTINSVEPLPPDGDPIWGPVDRFEVHFSEVMNAGSVNDPSHWELLEAGADGLFETADDAHWPIMVAPLYVDGLSATLRPNVERLPAGSYRLRAASGGLKDLFGTHLDGNADGLGGDDYQTHFVVLSGNRYPADDAPKEIADLGTITSTLSVDDSFLVADVDVQVWITHSYDNDLDVFLTSPGGTRIELFTDVGGSGDGFAGTVLDDEAATLIRLGTAPFDGRYQPEGLLRTLDGSPALGTWTLEISDDARLDTGTLDAWALIIEPESGPPPQITGHRPDSVTVGPVGTIRIDFDRPMDPGSFSLSDDVWSFTGPGGPLLPTDFRWLDPQTLEILFDPQSAPGAYTMVLGPRILDTAGTALDQDGDSRAGEIPDDQYAATFVLAQTLDTVAFEELDGLDPSAADLWYHFLSARRGILTLQANFQVGLGNVELALYDDSGTGTPVAVSTPTYGNRRIDREVAAPGEVYYLKLSGTNADVDLRLANLLSQEGDAVTVFGTGGADRFEFSSAGDSSSSRGSVTGTSTARQVTINGLRYEFDAAEVSSVTFHGGSGNDEVVFSGSDDPETVRMWPGRGVLAGNGYTVTVDGAGSITARGDAADTAHLYDSAESDTFVATPEFAVLSRDGYSNRAEWFGEVYAYGSPGSADVALFYDNPAGPDRFKAWPDVAGLFGDTFYNWARSFDSVRAYATEGGGDMAQLYDNPDGTDDLKAWPDRVRFYGDGFDNEAHSFDYVQAYATKGYDDWAVLYDDPSARDLFQAWPDEARLYGEGFDNRVKSFRYVHALATEGGTDVARLYDDPDGKDTFQASPDQARLFGNGFDNRVKSFRYVHAYGTPHSRDLAVLYDSAGQDTFQAWPRLAKLAGNGFYNRANSFRYVRAYATEGGDLAELYDSDGKDTFEAYPDMATLFGDGFYNRVKSFPDVRAYATEGGDDVAKLFDSALHDLLEAHDNWARLSNADLAFANLAVAFPTVEATSSNEGDTTDIDATVDFLITYGPWQL